MAPHQSMRCSVRATVARNEARKPSTARPPTGMFTKKIQCHEKTCVNQPPISGPITEETPNTAAKTPWILPRSLGAMTSRDGREGEHEESAAAQALQGPRGDQEGHRAREPAERGAEQEQAHRDEHHRAAAVEVAELAVERRHDGRGEDVGGHHPAQVIEPAEVRDDGRKRGRDDGLVERSEQQEEADGDDDEAGAAGGFRAGAAGRPGARTPRGRMGTWRPREGGVGTGRAPDEKARVPRRGGARPALICVKRT